MPTAPAEDQATATATSMAGSAPRWLRAAEWAALVAVLVSAIAFGLVRIACSDVPIHLATARLARELGHAVVENSFSYTFPTHPVYQQYPLFQGLLLAIQERFGFEGLSVLLCTGWLLVLLLFVAWGGGLRRAAPLHLAWMLALLVLQRRMILRPDMLSMIWLGLLLLSIDRYLSGRHAWLLVVPLVHAAWVHSHSLFFLSLAVQLLLLVHLVAARLPDRLTPGFNRRRDSAIPIAPVLGSLVASVALSFTSPVGARIFAIVPQLFDSVASHRHDIAEFARIWDLPVERFLAFVCVAPSLVVLWTGRRRLVLFDVGVWVLGVALTLASMRGLMLLGVASTGLVSRMLSSRPSIPAGARVAMVLLTLLLGANVLYHRWVDPPLILGGTQPGLGRSLGDWPDAATAELRRDPPPGRVMNLPWSLANAMVWELPAAPVFVDTRMESYPRAFLSEVMASYRDDVTLDRLLDRWEVSWIFAEHCRPAIRDRLVHLLGQGSWAATYVDTQTVVLVRDAPANRAYLDRRKIDLRELARGRHRAPVDLLESPQVLRERQLSCFEALTTALRHLTL